MVKDSCCSCKEPDFGSQQHLSGILKPPLCKSRYRRANALFWPVRTYIPMNEILKLQTPALFTERFCHVSNLSMDLFYHPFTMIQRNIQEMNVQKQNKTQNTLTENERQVAQQASMVSPPPCLSVTDKPVQSWSCVFSCMCLVTAIKALTPSCLAPTLSSLSPGEPRLLLSSSLSKK